MINAMDQKLKNVQCFTGNQLKLIACLCMLIDHVSKIPMSKYMDKLFSLSLEGMISEEQFLHFRISKDRFYLVSVPSLFLCFAFY